MSRTNTTIVRRTLLAESAFSRLLLALPFAGALWLAVAWAWGGAV